jgi:hypothetical protein
MIVSWKFESRMFLRENSLPSSSNSKLDSCFMFLMQQRFMEIINDLDISHRLSAWKYFSTTGDESVDTQKDILDDDLLLLLLFSLSS